AKSWNNLPSVSTHASAVLRGHSSAVFLRQDARKMRLPSRSVDYIIFDPPQTDEIQYFELSFLGAKWLGFNLPFENEITVNLRQGKTTADYWSRIRDVFRESVRLLKPNAHITVLLHGEDTEYFSQFSDIFQASRMKHVSKTFNGYDVQNGLHRFDRNRLDGDYYVTLRKVDKQPHWN